MGGVSVQFIVDNLGTIAVGAIVALVIGVVAFIMIRDKAQGKSSCGGGCAGCPMSDKCHKRK